MCTNISLSYIYDMYKLFTTQDIEHIALNQEKKDFSSKEIFFLQENMIITFSLPKFFDPNLWLFNPFRNILFYNHKKECAYESLELYINSTHKLEKFYVIGEKSNVLISDSDRNSSLSLHPTTIDMLLQRSLFCNRPFIFEDENLRQKSH